MKTIKKLFFLFITLVAMVGLAGCSNTAATTSDMCAYVQGDGQNGNDATVRRIVYPNQQANDDPREKVFFFPCNQRNVRFTPGSGDLYSNGQPLTYITARNKNGNEVRVDLTAYWTPNQDKEVLMKTTIPILQKYNAAVSDPSVRTENFATPGWTGWLAENVIPTLESSTRDIVREGGNELWEDSEQKQQLAVAVAEAFMRDFKTTTGTTKDVICGSGESSGWSNPNTPGEGTFNCGTIRIKVDRIEPLNTGLLDAKARADQASAVAAANAAELEAAKAKYGEKAGEVLGQLDVIRACREAGMTSCATNVNGGVSVSKVG